MSRKSVEIQFVFINISKKRNHILICWKWVSTAKQIQPKHLNIYGILLFGLHFMGLIYHYSALNFAVFIWNVGMKASKSARNSKFLKCENYHISDFGLILFTGLCLDAIFSSLGNTDYEFSLPHSMKERKYLPLCLWNIKVTFAWVGKEHRLISDVSKSNREMLLNVLCVSSVSVSVCVCVLCPGKQIIMLLLQF